MDQSTRDALADAETLRLFAEEAWNDSFRSGDDLYPDATNLALLLHMADLGRGGRCKRFMNKGTAPMGMIDHAAHAAFLAVPGLREE